jgi:IS30 family transposase
MDPTLKAQIHRLYTQDGWPIGSIARELKLHHSTVERAVRSPIESRLRPVRATIFDDHRKFIKERYGHRHPAATSILCCDGATSSSRPVVEDGC